ncbi:MAG: 2OG-Fe(II) oxygenase [Lamprocystis purpurea]|jgi:hypothetical protein|uniref:2OG-Fe(II) oxygenase n=1 Tax=Lamprocystis purpurea TaxID=61598 RepID=UPI000375F777|nr:2OG-Fe(II) oxygenase [Lamprocystis purpurea]MBV5272642.1 2OG-Fe(II) oxygenase [Lamprocystis purpurea]
MNGELDQDAVSETAASHPWVNARIQRCVLPGAAAVNAAILTAFQTLTPESFDRRSHLVGGRYENLYLERARMPALAPVLEHALHCAATILGESAHGLRCGFWFNATGPGHHTSEHTHDECDERLSAVYYVDAPADCGDLILYDGPLTMRVTPVAGTLLFFPPNLPHAVEPNRSGQLRLSIGINFGPLPADL